MVCYAVQYNLPQSAGGMSGLRPYCVATPVGSFIGIKWVRRTSDHTMDFTSCEMHKDFIGFKFEDGTWYGTPVKPADEDGDSLSWADISIDDIVSGRVKILHAKSVLFRRQK